MKQMKRTIFSLLFVLFSTGLLAQEESVADRLLDLPGVWVKQIETVDHFTEAYEIRLTQPVDHNNPESPTFQQRIYVSHAGFDRPVHLETEGYTAPRNVTKELAGLLKANQIIVEHRFFAESAPEKMDWQYLNIEQAAADHHRIVTLFRQLYTGKWINSGWSKGGQTAMYHRYFYPEDVDVTVAFDSPLNFALEDPRIDRFFDTIGTKKQRQHLIQFQRLVLQNKAGILPLFRDDAWKKKMSFSIGQEKALEYMVLEYTFSFWQYHHIDPMTVPGRDATPAELYAHLKKVVSAGAYADRSMNSPAMYQFSTQLGYYGYVQKNVADLLSQDHYPNWAYAPQDTDLSYDPQLMKTVNAWIQTKGDRMLFIYADHDPWSAPQVMLTGETDALKMVQHGGNHFTWIKTFPAPEREKILTTLERWLDLKIDRSYFDKH